MTRARKSVHAPGARRKMQGCGAAAGPAANARIAASAGRTSGLLGSGDTWLVVVERASLDHSGLVDDRIDLAILRVES